MSFQIKVADVVFEIHPLYSYIEKFSKDYIVSHMKPDHVISISETDIQEEHQIVDKVYEKHMNYSDPYVETIVVLRKIANILPLHDRFLMHGAVIAYKNNGYVFSAPSGTGKSTHISLWKKYLGEEVTIINGDKPFLEFREKETLVYGTPWAGKEGWQTNTSVPLKAIVFLKQAPINRIYSISTTEAIKQMICQIHVPNDPDLAGKTLDLIDQVFSNVSFYQMECDISKEAFECSYQKLIFDAKDM